MCVPMPCVDLVVSYLGWSDSPLTLHNLRQTARIRVIFGLLERWERAGADAQAAGGPFYF